MIFIACIYNRHYTTVYGLPIAKIAFIRANDKCMDELTLK